MAVLALVVAAMVALGVVILRIQTVNFDYYREKVVDQMTYTSTVKAERGDIYDANGELLATNVTTYVIFISPQDIIDAVRKAGEPDAKEEEKIYAGIDVTISEGLSEICGVDYDTIYEMTGRKGSKYAVVRSSADKDTADSVSEFITEYKLGQMVYVRSQSSRHYIYGDLAAQVIGFTGTDGNGLYGLEYYYEDQLKGTDGVSVIATDSYGNQLPYEYESYTDAVDGYNLNTTIDIKIQDILETQLEKAYTDSGSQAGACGIVMNVKTGAIYAMATYPDFNNNDAWTLCDTYLAQLEDSGYDPSGSEYSQLYNTLLLRQWSNKAVSDTYIPGSTFKIITASIALERSVVTTTEKFTCTGVIKVADYKIHCHNLNGHGVLTFAEGLQQSCNPIFIQVGLRVGTSGFYSAIKNFGYLEKTNIDLPGEGTTIFWDEDDFKEIDLATCAFGQNFKMSAIRHLTSIAAVANGGYLVEPYLVSSITNDDGEIIYEHESTPLRQVCSTEICQKVASILEEGVSGNGGSRNAYVAGYRVAAKTGTSEKIGDNETMKIGSCAAFAPANDPEVAIIIMVDEPTTGSLFGSVVAAPYVANCLKEIMPYLGVETSYTAEEEAKLEKEISDYRGIVSYTAKEAVEKIGLKCEIIGVGTVVTAQVPEAGTTLSKSNGKVYLYVGDSAPEYTIRIPDVTGLSATAAQTVLINSGLNINVSGATNYANSAGAVVYAQYPSQGSIATKGDVVEINLRYLDIADDN